MSTYPPVLTCSPHAALPSCPGELCAAQLPVCASPKLSPTAPGPALCLDLLIARLALNRRPSMLASVPVVPAAAAEPLQDTQRAAKPHAGWQVTAAAKRAAQRAALPPQWMLPEAVLMEAGSDVRSVASSCGLLSAAQLELTKIDEATVLLERIANRQYSAVEVIDAYCGRAAIAHQLVRNVAALQ